MRGEWTRQLGRGRWGALAVGVVAALALGLLLARPREQTPTPELPAPLGQPSAAVIDAYLGQVRAATAAYHAQRDAEAVRAFEAASTLQPSEPLPYRYLAELYWRLGRHEQALRAVHSLAGVMPDAYFLDHVGMAYEESGLRELAVLFYQEAVRLDPQLPGARYNLGRAYLGAGDLERGVAEVREVLRLHPDFPEAHQALGMAYTELGRLEEAIIQLEHALALQPDLTLVRNHLGRIYLAQGRLEEAIQTFRVLVARAPDIAEARHNLAVAYARKGLQEEAIEQFGEALRLRSDFRAARIDLATLLLEMGRPQGAIDTLQGALADVSSSPAERDPQMLAEVRYRLGIAYQMAGHPQDAVRELEAVLGVQPAHAWAHATLARLYYQTREFDRAWRHARRSESLGVPVPQLLAALRRVSVEPP